jgi:ATP phosphoribosyltransferase
MTVSPQMKVALPSGKSLQEPTMTLLKEAGIEIKRPHPRSCLAAVNGAPGITSAVFCTPAEIVRLVGAGHVDLGITGVDFVRERERSSDTEDERPIKVVDLEYSKATNGGTRCVLFTRQSNRVDDVYTMPRSPSVATEYPVETRMFLQQNGVSNPRIVHVRGSAEAFVAIDAYDYGVTLVETGDTLKANNLKAIGTIFTSSAILIRSYKTMHDPQKVEYAEFLGDLLVGTLRARSCVYLMMNAPVEAVPKITAALPALKSPTVQPHANPGFVSIASVVPNDQLNELKMTLRKMGASGFLVTSLKSVL